MWDVGLCRASEVHFKIPEASRPTRSSATICCLLSLCLSKPLVIVISFLARLPHKGCQLFLLFLRSNRIISDEKAQMLLGLFGALRRTPTCVW